MGSYAVVFTYSFDCDAAVYLFDTFEKAVQFLEDSYNEELRIDIEENGWDSKGFISDDKTYAKIINTFSHIDQRDITEFHLANVYT